MSPNPPKRTPLTECHEEEGARMVEFAGWTMPVQYRGVIEEHRGVRGAAGLFDVSHMGEIAVQGAGAESFLDRLTPNHVAKLKPGRAHYSALLTPTGTYLDDLLVYRLAADRFLLVVNAANSSGDFAHIASHAQNAADVEVEDVSARYALMALQGPRAADILAPLTAADLAAIKYYGFVETEVEGRSVLVSRTGYTGEDGFELYLAPDDAPPLWRRLLESGAGAGLSPAGLGARDTLRLEAGMALYGQELDETTTPYEAGLGWTVKLKKGEFVGSEALGRQQAEGPRRRLVGFEVTGRGIARHGHKVFVAGREVGAVTSGTWSPTLEKALGMAYVPTEYAAAGTEIEIEVRSRRLSAVIVDLPFYQRPK